MNGLLRQSNTSATPLALQLLLQPPPHPPFLPPHTPSSPLSRVYQDPSAINVGCSPPAYPTAQYIACHREKYIVREEDDVLVQEPCNGGSGGLAGGWMARFAVGMGGLALRTHIPEVLGGLAVPLQPASCSCARIFAAATWK
jgi:hypothetical protein